MLVLVAILNAQINFEGLLKDYQNGKNLNGKFHSGNYTFINYYNSDWDSWSGFAYSRMNDTLTGGYSNQYSAITGSGHNNSSNYVVSYVSEWNGPTYITLDSASSLNGVYITNSTYAYISMRDGDNIAKKFGGDSGNDPDWFKLTIKGFNNGSLTDSVEFYLADFRFADNSQDYIINQWTFVDLSSLSTIDSIAFFLSSSDTGAWGMNTPAYFCIDDITDTNNNITNFEEFDFDYWNGSDLSGGFFSGQAYFYNSYNENWGTWTGFAYSRKTDSTTAGWTNQYSAITASGHNSEAYGVSYGVSSLKFDTVLNVQSIFVTNSTYAYLSMRDGDMFTDAFGGDSGDEEDWFKLTIKGYNNGSLTDSVEFYLADFRFSDNSQDYIINQWTEVNLTSLGAVDSLNFSLSSSDVGSWGMNTPAYFCIDDINVSEITNINEISYTQNIKIYPNPATNFVNIKNAENATIEIYNLQGKLISTKQTVSNIERIDLSYLQTGVYIVRVAKNNKINNFKIIKK